MARVLDPHVALEGAILPQAKVSGSLPQFDQIIYYAYDGHIHIGLGSRLRGEIRIQFREGGPYQLATSDLVAKLPGAVTSAIAVVASAISGVGGWIPVAALFFLLFLVLR